MPTEKELQFEKLWEGETPKGRNEAKALQFRQKMRMALSQKGVIFTKENAKLYWTGMLKGGEDRLAEEEREYREKRAFRGERK
ncbi:MAG: hypothetical protein QXP70_01260 [Methanomassiliicoccales archaeon]